MCIIKRSVINIKRIPKYVEKRIEELADLSAKAFGNAWFLLAHIIWFACWIIFKVEDFPFGLLTMIVSLEAIILSSLILSSTDRESERDRNKQLIEYLLQNFVLLRIILYFCTRNRIWRRGQQSPRLLLYSKNDIKTGCKSSC